MEIHLADQKIKRVHKIWERPQLQPQPLWHGPPPDGIKKIFTRRALAAEYRESYCKWASNCALLTNEFLAEVYARHRETYEEPSPRWLGFPYSDDSYCCHMANRNLWVNKQDGRWNIEFCEPDADPGACVLTIEKMIVLCPDALWAARLAMACSHEPPANLAWCELT